MATLRASGEEGQFANERDGEAERRRETHVMRRSHSRLAPSHVYMTACAPRCQQRSESERKPKRARRDLGELGHARRLAAPVGEVERQPCGSEFELKEEERQPPVAAPIRLADDPDSPPARGRGSCVSRARHCRAPAPRGVNDVIDAREECLTDEDVRTGEAGVNEELDRHEGEDGRVEEGRRRVPPGPRAVLHRVAECRQGEKADEQLEGKSISRAEAQEVRRGCEENLVSFRRRGAG